MNAVINYALDINRFTGGGVIEESGAIEESGLVKRKQGNTSLVYNTGDVIKACFAIL
jgi:hypothetical protein